MKLAINLILGNYYSDLLEYNKAQRDMTINPNEYSDSVIKYLTPRIKDYEDALKKLEYKHSEPTKTREQELEECLRYFFSEYTQHEAHSPKAHQMREKAKQLLNK